MQSIRRYDYGFFGPGSPSWKVWTAPTALIGFQRAVVLEHFDPFLAAAVADSAGIYQDPRGRLDHTLAYFLIVAVADGRTVVEASDHLMRVHAKATGVEPITGRRYSANNPSSQLWIHITGWHSVLKCYERYGPGPLSPAEESQYWAESRIAAELQTCKPSDVPASRDEVRQYFADVHDSLCTSERADRAMQYLLYTPRDRGFRLWAGSRILAPAATLSGAQPFQGTVFHATIQVGRRLPGLVPGAPEAYKRLLNDVLSVGPARHPLAREQQQRRTMSVQPGMPCVRVRRHACPLRGCHHRLLP